MNNVKIGTTFYIGKTEYIVDDIMPVDASLTNIIKAMQETGKDTVQYMASKVLKSGKKSKQGGVFLRFTDTNRFISAF